MVLERFNGVKMANLVVRLHSGQRAVWDSKARFIAMLAGTQGGKTAFGPHWLHREIQQRGPGDYLAVTATFPLLNLKMLPETLTVFQHILGLGEYNEAKKTFTVSKQGEVKLWGKEQPDDTPTRLIFASATNPESIESATAKAAWLDEAGQKQFKRESWEAIQRRLSIHQGRVLFTTTVYNLGWLKTEVYDRWKARDSIYDVIQFDSTVNPTFPIAEYDRARNSLPAWKFDMFYRGKYTKPAGLIYDCFDETTAVIPRFEIPKSWMRYVGHDFGPVHTAAMFYAQDPGTGFLYAYREYQTSEKRTAAQNVEVWKRDSVGENIIQRRGGSHTEEGWRESYTLAGWPISEPAVNDVEVGIDRAYAWSKQNKLFVFNDLYKYLDQKLSYSRELDDNYEPTEKIDDKARYHLMDAERYILSSFRPVDILEQANRPRSKRSVAV